MSDHEFENQVRQKLNNLKITPSPQAWENIEGKIQERGRRRAPFIWLPLLLTGMVAGVYLITHTVRDTVPRVMPPQQTEIKANDHAVAEEMGNKQAADRYAPASGQLKNSKNEQPVTVNKNKSSVVKNIHGQSLLLIKSHSVYHTSGRNNNTDEVTEIPDASVTASQESKESTELAEAVTGQQKPPAPEHQEIKKNKTPALASAAPQPATASLSKPPARKFKDSKWSFAANVYSGVVAVNDGGLLKVDKPNVEDVAYTPSFSGSVSTNYAPQYKPSTISPGFAFSAGAEVKRGLSHRVSISAGLNYTQLNTHTKVGERVNSSQIVNNGTRGYLYVQSYYLLDRNENIEYRNRYHFIEIPVTLHTRINRNENLPIYWNAGLTLSRLLSSNSLHFDGTTGVYYKNDRLLNQTQAGITTGFSLALFNKTAHPLWIGPSAGSNISTILKKDISSRKHFVTLGLDVKFFLKR